MKEWNEPTIADLSVMNTEASIVKGTTHDGVIYDTQYGEFEGWIS